MIAIVLVAQNRTALTAEILPTGDAAADVLLVEHAKHEWLLTGHYSRFDFHHPGPFFFELRRLGEWLAGDAVPGPFNGDLLGVLIGNALFIGIGSAAAALLAGAGWQACAAAIATAIVVLVQAGRDSALSDTWMPSVVVVPFFAFVLLLAQVARGRVRLLPATTLCAGALAHGYVVLLPIVALALPLATATGLRRRTRRGGTVPRWIVPTSVVIAVVFAMPPLIDVVLHFPGNLGRIVATSLATPAGPGRSWSAALRFVAQYWTDLATLPAAVAFVAVLLGLTHRPSHEPLAAILGVIVLLTAALVVIVKRAPDELYPYIARFYLGAPLALECAAIALAIGRLSRRGARNAAAALAILGLGVAARADLGGRERGDPSLRVLTTAIQRDARAHGFDTVELAFEPDDRWPVAAGLLVDLGRQGEQACVAAADWGVLFTPERLCRARGEAARYVVVPPDACGTTCLARTEDAGIMLSSGERAAGATAASD
ncbi:hypothetical protein K2Z84_08335 [Candidatus Binatia bacterium]|nr:hypothetical protein [Candidatus Binatia bacterium]